MDSSIMKVNWIFEIPHFINDKNMQSCDDTTGLKKVTKDVLCGVDGLIFFFKRSS